MVNYFKAHFTIISTSLFVLLILLAHVFASSNYHWTKNTISDLGAQGYERKLIMQLGFIVFGLALVLGHLFTGLTWRTSPILVYGICVALTGIFCTRPFVGIEVFSITQSNLHSIFAQIA
jgi:hypothetical membrane protein